MTHLKVMKQPFILIGGTLIIPESGALLDGRVQLLSNQT